MINATTVYCIAEAQVTIWCQMRFNRYPLDEHSCKFRLGSFTFNQSQLSFTSEKLLFKKKVHNTVLDYSVKISELKEEDKIYNWEADEDYSVAGFELKLKRHSLKYIFNYYLPSGLFVVMSWVRPVLT